MAEMEKLFASLLSCWPLSTPSALRVNNDGCIMSFSTSGIVLTRENANLQNLVCHTVRFVEVDVLLFWWPS